MVDGPVRIVHLVAKTHLDLGFTALAAEVVERYVDDFFPRAVATAAALRDGGGPARLVWTTGSWVLAQALDRQGTAAQRAAIDAGIRGGDLAWHALPVTTHTELMDAALVRSGLAVAAGLDHRYGRRTTAAKMTDVPGHTRALVPLLAEAGVTFLHLGVNPAWPVPDVPPVFRWRSPDGAEVTVAYQAGGYGGDVVIPGCDEALSFLHSGDNLGPPSADEVVAAHAALAARHPGAEIRASTLDAFARGLAGSGAVAGLPVVTAEIGDPWLFGAGSDPQKVAGYRRALRARSTPTLSPADRAAVDADLLLVAEHTWGLDEKVALDAPGHWDRAGLAALRTGPAGRRFVASWAEQRAYVDRATDRLAAAGVTPESVRVPVGPGAEPGDGWASVPADAPVTVGGWRLDLDAGTGAVVGLISASGRVLADPDHRLGLVTYQGFAEADYDRFYRGLRPLPEDEWWARRDNTKPGIDAAGARSGRWHPRVDGVWWRPADDGAAAPDRLLVRARFDPALTDELGAPPVVLTEWSARPGAAALTATVTWRDKPGSRLPETTWCSWNPIVADPDRWTMDKLGQPVSPLDVVRRGGRGLHAVGEGVAYDGPDGPLRLGTVDAPLVAPGAPALLDADPPVPDLAGGWHVLLHDNCWGTNFPMWNDGDATFRFSLSVG